MMEEIKANIKRIIEEGYNKGNVDILDEMYAADSVRHRPPFQDIEGLEALKEHAADMFIAFPDGQGTIEEIIVEGDRSATRWSARATHTGQSPVLPIPPTGRQVITTVCSVSHWVGGKCVEEWEYIDFLGFLQQLGLVPAMGGGGG